MKNITIVLQRSELNYLIKYDTIKISSDRIISFSYNEFRKLSSENKVLILENSLPIYEQDHEVLLIEYDSKLVSYDNAPKLEFKGISSIIPLTDKGSRLLSAKLNIDFNILDYLDSNLYKSFINNRNHILRIGAGEKLCSLYDVPMPYEEFIEAFKNATLFQLHYSSPTSNDSTLAHLIDFNTTPSFIPEGNIEALIKSACVGMKKVDRKVDQVKLSKFYSFVIEHKKSINSRSFFQATQYVEDEIKLFDETKKGFNQLKETLSEDGKYDNAFLIFSYFYYLKKEMEKNDYDVSAPKNAILELKYNDLEAASKVLFMLGYTFSIQTISKSIQSFSNSQLLKTPKNLDLEWTPRETVKEVEESVIPNQGATEDKYGEVKNQVGNYQEPKPEDVVDKIHDEKPTTKTWIIDKKESEINKPEVTYLTEPRKHETKEPAQVHMDFSSDQNSVEDDQTNLAYDDPVCNLKELKKNIGTGKFAKDIIATINAKNIDEDKISKELLVSCLKEIGQYTIKNGDISKNAEKALKVFE